MNCERFTSRGQPCPTRALYEVDVPSPTLISSQGVVVCGRHLREVVDEAYAEVNQHVESGALSPDHLSVAVRRTPDAPRLPSLHERLQRVFG